MALMSMALMSMALMPLIACSPPTKNLHPWLATRWDRPNPLPCIFHVRSGVPFSDGHLLPSAGVA